MRFNALLLVVLFVAAACTQVDWVRPQAVYEATATARAQLAELPPLPTVQPDVVPEQEVGETEPDPTPQPPCELLVKGNISRDGRKLYHEPGMSNYEQVKIDEKAGEMWFCSVEEAEAAGWTRAGN